MARIRATPASRVCCDCGIEFRPHHYARQRCQNCNWFGPYRKARARAIAAVFRAVKAGVLAHLGSGDTPCVDCGRAAKHYDHRDYSKPLDVSPVCRSCNFKRGAAAYQSVGSCQFKRIGEQS